MKTVRFLFTASLSALLAGCVGDAINEVPDGTGQHGEIRFEIGFGDRTRVSTGAGFTSAWENGDEIGVFAVAHDGTLAGSGNYIHNAKLTYNGTTWTAESPLYWPTTGDGIPALDFYAYYPYDAGAADPTAITFNVQSDQSAAADYGASDLLAARSDNGGSGWSKGSTVALTFGHALSLVQLAIDDAVGVLDANDEIAVTLLGVKTVGTLNLGTPEVSASGAASNITMYRVEQPDDANYSTSFTFRGLVPAQTLAAGSSLFRIANGDLLLSGSALTSDVAMAAGVAEKFTQTISPGDGLYTAEARRFIRWAQLTDGWKATDFMLTSDIDLTGYDWKPVGENAARFTQTFDGGGHTIKGLSVNTSATYAGLFGLVGSGGSVRNVTVSGTVSGTVTGGWSYTGGIAGYSDSGGTITGCSFSGTIEGTVTGANVGGIAGYSASAITGCSFSGTVTGNDNYSRVGGIAGYSAGTITGSWSAAKSVTGTGSVGGIAGWNVEGAIRYCYWLWDNITSTGFDGNAVGLNDGTLSNYSSFATVSALNGKVSDMNTEILSSGWEWVEGDNTATDWPTIQKLP